MTTTAGSDREALGRGEHARRRVLTAALEVTETMACATERRSI